jgi:hypothetical protein
MSLDNGEQEIQVNPCGCTYVNGELKKMCKLGREGGHDVASSTVEKPMLDDDIEMVCINCGFGEWRHKDGFNCKKFDNGLALAPNPPLEQELTPYDHEQLERLRDLLAKFADEPYRQTEYKIIDLVMAWRSQAEARASMDRMLDLKALRAKERIKVYHEVVQNWDKPGFKKYILTLYDNDLKIRKEALDRREVQLHPPEKDKTV